MILEDGMRLGQEENPPTQGFSPSVVPVLVYRDAVAAIDWLKRAFSFEEIFRVPGAQDTIRHAELRWDSGAIMIASAHDNHLAANTGYGWVYVVVRHLDDHYHRAHLAGAEIIDPPADEFEGSRGYRALDPEGNQWKFSTRRLSPSGHR